jgi:cysteine desulfurase/selenocysteine lyase
MNLKDVRRQFPQLTDGSVYLDSAATSLKPNSVIERMTRLLSAEVSNVHRGGHKLGNAATTEYEGARGKVARFLNAASPNEIIFTRGTTESLNLVACCLAEAVLQPGDEVILTQIEHHSNIVPWQIWAERKGLRLRFVKIDAHGVPDFSHFEALLNEKSKVLSLSQLSNALGVNVEVKRFIQKAKERGLLTVVDAAQSVSAHKVDVRDLGCDFLVFSGHKIFAPTGVGVLYGREELLNRLPPYQGGGSMIDQVTEEGVSFLPAPQRFEAGTPAIAQAIGLGEALDFVGALDWKELEERDQRLVALADEAVSGLGFQVFARGQKRSHVVSFVWPGMHPSDFAAILSEMNVAVRAGHHCCQPLMKALGVPGTLRASFSIYSDENDVDRLVEALKKAKELLV